MKRILFVDDEPQILESLRDLLRKQRKEWDMVFAAGGVDALSELAKSPFDVVVSDMRMPVIDGAELLKRVKELYPTAARIILSGHADRDSVVRALPVAHQFLSKPCDVTRLRVVVERACELQRLLQDDCIRALIGKLDKLPSVPHTYAELTCAASRPDVAITDLAAIIERDPAMTVKVLQLVNSAYFGLPQQLSSVRQAVSYLGADLLKALALTAHAFGAMVPKPIAGFSLEQLQWHSLLTARLVKRMVPDPKRAGEAFTAAMVHDVGQIVFAVGVPEKFAEALRLERADGTPRHVLEKQLIGVTHAEVGAYLLGSWGLPIPIVEAVAYHHTPSLLADEPPELLAALHIADALLHERAVRPDAPPGEGWLDHGFIAAAGLAEQLPRFREIAESVHGPTEEE
jgi:HD-like signal output (HDOD) protein